MAESVVTLRVDATSATRALNGVQNRTNKLQNAFGGLRTALGGIGFTLLAKNAIQTSTNFEKLNIRLGLLTKATGDFAAAQKIATDGQKLFGLSATEALEGVTNITARLKPLGTSLEDIRTTFIGFNTAAKLGGASSQEAANAFRQLAQALGSGRLAGDEFRSVSEQIPLVLKPLSEELGVSTGELKKLAAEGKLTSEVVIRALSKLADEGGEDLKAILENDPTQVFKNLSNEAENLSRAFGEALTPAVLPVVKGLTALTVAATNFVNSPIGKTALIFTAIAVAAKGTAVAVGLVSAAFIAAGGAAGVLAIALNALPFVAIATAIGAVTTAFIKQNDEQKKFNKLVKEGGQEALRAEMLKIDAERLEILRRLAKAEENNNKRAINSLTKQLNILDGQYTIVRDRLHEEIKITNQTNKTNKELEDNKQIQEEINQLEKDNLQKAIAYEQAEMDAVAAKGKLIEELSNQKALAQAALDGNLEQVKTQQEINALVAIHGEGMRDVITAYIEGTNELKKQKTEADLLKNKFDEIGAAIETSLKDNLRDAITGAQSFGEAMTNILNKIRDKIIDAQLDKLLGNFGDDFTSGATGTGGGGIGGVIGSVVGGVLGPIGTIAGGLLGGLFADGGRPPVNKISVVGEKGPELFVPRTAGTIIPNNQLGGGTTNNYVTVNVEGGAATASGNNVDLNALGQVIGVVVQAQLVKEKQAGGILTR